MLDSCLDYSDGSELQVAGDHIRIGWDNWLLGKHSCSDRDRIHCGYHRKLALCLLPGFSDIFDGLFFNPVFGLSRID